MQTKRPQQHCTQVSINLNSLLYLNKIENYRIIHYKKILNYDKYVYEYKLGLNRKQKNNEYIMYDEMCGQQL